MSANGTALPNTISSPTENAPQRISPLFNEVFLKVFGESATAARGLANAVLRHAGLPEIGMIDRISTDASIPGAVGLKAARCDVVLFADGQIVDLEAQRYKTNLDNKALFYAAKLIVDNTPKGDDRDFESIPQVVVISLIEGHTMFQGGQFITSCKMAWQRDTGLIDGTDRMVFIAIELEKVAKAYNRGVTKEVLADELTAWLYLLARGYRDKEEVDEIMEVFSTIEEFAEYYGLAIDDPEVKRMYEAYDNSVFEYNSIVHQAKKDGHAEGRKEAACEMASELRKLGVAEEAIEEALKRIEASNAAG